MESLASSDAYVGESIDSRDASMTQMVGLLERAILDGILVGDRVPIPIRRALIVGGARRFDDHCARARALELLGTIVTFEQAIAPGPCSPPIEGWRSSAPP